MGYRLTRKLKENLFFCFVYTLTVTGCVRFFPFNFYYSIGAITFTFCSYKLVKLSHLSVMKIALMCDDSSLTKNVTEIGDFFWVDVLVKLKQEYCKLGGCKLNYGWSTKFPFSCKFFNATKWRQYWNVIKKIRLDDMTLLF